MSTVLASDYVRWISNTQPIEKRLGSSWEQTLPEPQVPDDTTAQVVLEELVSACFAQASFSVGFPNSRLAWTRSMNTGAVTADIENSLEWLQGEQVKLINTDTIREYMRLHSDMTSAVDIVASLVRSRFGKDVELLLDVYNDPEIDDQYLRLRMRTINYNSEFMNLIDAVDALVGPILQHGTGRLLLTTDFVPIR